jgi:fucose permease
LTQHPNTASLTTARWSVLAMFFINGALFANWWTRIPAFKDRFALSDSQLGFTLLAVSAGVICSLAVVSGIIARVGSAALSAVLACFSLPAVALMPHPIALWIGLFIFGVGTSAMDMGMNAQAAEVERRKGSPLMSSFHGSFSMGTAAGALIGAEMARFELVPQIHFAAVSAVFLLIALIALRGLIHVEGEKGEGESVFQFPVRALWGIGAIAFCSALGEGSIADWGAVYLKDTLGAPADVAARGLAVYSIAMMIGRFSGDWLVARFKPAMVVRIGGLVAGLGMLLAMVVREPLIAIVGFAAVGIGVANAIPLAFSAAGNTPGVAPSRGIAGVATIGYASFLAGPPVIGMIADATSRSFALSIIGVLILSLTVLAGALNRASVPAATPAGEPAVL